MGRMHVGGATFRGLAAAAGLALAGCQSEFPTRPDIFDLGLNPALKDEGPAAPSNVPVTTERIQSQVMDFTDDFTIRLADMTDRIEARHPPMETRIAIHRLRYTVAHGLTVIAAGPNPHVAMIDAVVMMSLQARLVEERLVPAYFEDMPWVSAVFREGAAQIRGYAAESLTETQLAEIDTLVNEWLAANEYRHYAAYVRLADFSSRRTETQGREGEGRSQSIFGLLFLDPLAGLDPTTRELEQSRLFAERAMFYLQRMPELVSWQAELLYLDTAAEPEVAQVLLNLERLTQSFETVTDDARSLREDLPGLVAAEREAAVDQAMDRLFEGLAAERTAALDELAARGEDLEGTLEQFRATFEAGDELAVNATTLAESIQALTRQIQEMRGEPDEGRADGEGDEEGTDIRDYQAAIESATTLTERIDGLVASLDALARSDAWEERRATIDAVTGDAQARVNAVVDRAYRRLLVIVAVALAGTLVVGLALKLVPSRRARA